MNSTLDILAGTEKRLANAIEDITSLRSQLDAAKTEIDMWKNDAVFLADVWITIRAQGLEYIHEHGDLDGIDFVASQVITVLVVKKVQS